MRVSKQGRRSFTIVVKVCVPAPGNPEAGNMFALLLVLALTLVQLLA